MQISIFGTGYVGLVAGACLADLGHNVLCIDIDEAKIQKLQNGVIPIYEARLEEIVKKNVKNGKLSFSTDAKKWIQFGKVVFNAVGTPPDKENQNRADLKYVYSVAESFAQFADEYKVLVNKSTVPVGTAHECEKLIRQKMEKWRKNIDFSVVSNPEFLREGTAVYDFMTPDRIIIGSDNSQAKALMQKVYQNFEKQSEIIFTDQKSAEILKYASNAFLATKLSFVNEMARFVEKVGGNIQDITHGMGADPRIGDKFLNAGIGYGGSCFPKDIDALLETGKEVGYDFQIIKATQKINEVQKTILLQKLRENIQLEGKKIAILGVAYKPGTDDTRDAPSIKIVEELLAENVEKVQIFDPIAMNSFQKLFPNEERISYTKNTQDALTDADAMLLLTEWKKFQTLSADKILENMKGKIVLDGRNVWQKEHFENLGGIYYWIGK